jgi:hypothetical protein
VTKVDQPSTCDKTKKNETRARPNISTSRTGRTLRSVDQTFSLQTLGRNKKALNGTRNESASVP